MTNNNQNRNNNNYNKNNNQNNKAITPSKNPTTGEIDIEKTIKENKNNMPTTTQLRLLLSNSVIVKNKIELEKNTKNNEDYKISEELQNEIKYLLIKHIYQCGRDESIKRFDEGFDISKKLKDICDSKEKFDQYYRYLEEIVAYVKYYKG